MGYTSEQRTPILGSGADFTAKKQFLANVEAAIEQARDTSVVKYQDVLQYARSKLDFVLGEQLCMCPSDMYLVVGRIQLQQRDSGCYHSHASRNKPESEH